MRFVRFADKLPPDGGDNLAGRFFDELVLECVGKNMIADERIVLLTRRGARSDEVGKSEEPEKETSHRLRMA